MRILVVGSGGREHALCWKLAQEAEVFCTPGNPGIAKDCETLDVAVTDHDGLTRAARSLEADLVVVGPEDPLVQGLSDRLLESSFGGAVFGPRRAGAQHEGSKSWSKHQMEEVGVPTAAHRTFRDPAEAKEYTKSRFDGGFQVVVKASGPALGKGVVVCDTNDEAASAIDEMLVARKLGSAGETVVVEDRLIGREFSILTIVSDGRFRSLPVAQDYKRAFDGDQGPNTGGMGSYSPVPWLSEDTVSEAEQWIVKPMVDHMSRMGIDYRGVLFSGVMIHNGRPYCLEYNVRFGDPEVQTLVRRLGPGLADTLLAAARGEGVPLVPILDNAAVTVVVASGGYPGGYEKGKEVRVGVLPDSVEVFHAGTAGADGRVVTNGGRVLAVSAVGSTLAEARAGAYEGVAAVGFEGAFHRSDIAASY
ncbi:MAG: phosphoribosylamine--glycine ligase [Armatimonadetes bacterium]|nr:phosphoribosylamine--glycine ligase [Armatimonadota bacterium]